MIFEKHKTNGNGKKILSLTLSIIATAILMHWTWNKIGVELLELPESQFSHALALLLSILSVTWLIRKLTNTSLKRIDQ